VLGAEGADPDLVAGAEEDPPVPAILLPLEEVDGEEVADQRPVEVGVAAEGRRLVEGALAPDPVEPGRRPLAVGAEAELVGPRLLAGRVLSVATYGSGRARRRGIT
jgi:hypothetical protein